MKLLNILANCLEFELRIHDGLGIVATVFAVLTGNAVAAILNLIYVLIVKIGGQWFVDQARHTANL